MTKPFKLAEVAEEDLGYNYKHLGDYGECPVRYTQRRFKTITRKMINEVRPEVLKQENEEDELEALSGYCPIMARFINEDESYELVIGVAQVMQALGYSLETYLKFMKKECFFKKEVCLEAWEEALNLSAGTVCTLCCNIDVPRAIFF